MKVETKDAIASRYLEYPLIHMFVRAVLFSAGFRFCLIALCLGAISGGLFLTKMWRVTPPGFSPVVRISGLDWIQALSLHHAAKKQLAAGKAMEGLATDALAIANNPGDVELIRSFLQSILAHAKPPAFQSPALAHSFWFMQLTATNLNDLELPVAVLNRYGLDAFALQLLFPQRDQLTPPLQKAFLRGLFEAGYLSDFDAYWHLTAAAPLANDTEAQLYRAAFEAGWGNPDTAGKAKARLLQDLDRANLTSSDSLLAHRLYLRVCEAQSDVPAYFETLHRLAGSNRTRLIDHVRGWRLLASSNQHDRAVELARAFRTPPATAVETMQLAEAYQTLGLHDEVKQLLQRFSPEYSYLDGLWVMYGDRLIDSGEWSEVRRLALDMRLNRAIANRLKFYSLYLEGRADLADHRPGSATSAFAAIANERIENLEFGVMMAKRLVPLGQGEVARSVLASVEKLGAQSPAYWDAVAEVALSLKDAGLLLRATSRSAELQPDNWRAIHNRASAALVAGANADAVISDTLATLLRFPNLPEAKINHALALLQKHRVNEADALLATLSAATLNESQRAQYQLACLETLIEQKRFPLATLALNGVNATYLFPPQLEHLAALRARLPTPNQE